MSLQKNLSNSVKVAYKSQQKTSAAFSEDLGISRSTLQEIMKGNSNSRLDTIELIAKGLHTEPLELLSASSTEKDLALLIPLIKFSSAIYALPVNKKTELASHLYAVIRILTSVDPKDEK